MQHLQDTCKEAFKNHANAIVLSSSLEEHLQTGAPITRNYFVLSFFFDLPSSYLLQLKENSLSGEILTC